MPDPKELELQNKISQATRLGFWDDVTHFTKELRDYKADKAAKDRK